MSLEFMDCSKKCSGWKWKVQVVLNCTLVRAEGRRKSSLPQFGLELFLKEDGKGTQCETRKAW